MSIRLRKPKEVTGDEDDILAIREVWQRYASPAFVDLLDTDYVAPDERQPAFADLDTIRIKPPKLADPVKKLEDILRKRDESK